MYICICIYVYIERERELFVRDDGLAGRCNTRDIQYMAEHKSGIRLIIH